MGLMDMIKRYSERKNVDKKKYKEAESNMKIEKMLLDRQKSANERELEKIMKQKREDNIKVQLDHLHKQENKEMWKNKHSILDKGVSITKNERPILKEKHIFMNHDKKHSILNNSGGGMGFKW